MSNFIYELKVTCGRTWMTLRRYWPLKYNNYCNSGTSVRSHFILSPKWNLYINYRSRVCTKQ